MYSKQVDKRYREPMVKFLKNHLRYNTMNSWNRSTSYANNIKLYNVEKPGSVDNDTWWEILWITEWQKKLSDLLEDFGARHNWNWQAGINGKSGGYIVLYRGGIKPSGYMSYCPHCGQRNFKKVPEPPDEPITKPGDIWQLGDHRLMCGNSGEQADVDLLLQGEKIHLINTDPPYNVSVAPRSNNAVAAAKAKGKYTGQQGLDAAIRKGKKHRTDTKLRAKDRPLENDFVTDKEFAGLLKQWFGNIQRVLIPGRSFYIWGGYSNIYNYPNALKECKLYFSQMIIWVKEHPVLTRKDFMGNHEWCFYGWKEGASHKFFGPQNISDVWSVKKINPQSMIHLTEKPVELAVRAIQYSSKPGENVLDLFGGSGSTLIACEQTDRKAYLMEIDPLYCEVIVERWEKFTGRKAELIRNGKTPDIAVKVTQQESCKSSTADLRTGK